MDLGTLLASESYDFLRTDARLHNPMIIGLGGSHAYGTAVETSDVDIRGCALNTYKEILTNKDFEQVCDSVTDTTIYSFKKIVSLLVNCNPNVIELLGLKPSHYAFISDEGKLLLENKHIFLSQRAAHSFGGYATQQLRRLENGANKNVDAARQEEHLLHTLQRVQETFEDKGFEQYEGIKLYIAESNKEDMEQEIYFDLDFKHCPLADFNAMYGELSNVVREYRKIGMRNSKAIEHNKLAKHSMHLVRLFYMAFDILEKEEINTYREQEHELLMQIRRGDFLGADGMPTAEFFEMVDSLEKRFDYAKRNTALPPKPDMDAVDDLVMEINAAAIARRLC